MFGNDVTLSYAVLLGLAAASGWKLIIADRITQWLRHKIVLSLDKAGGFVPYHLLYLAGCALCAPMWIAIALYFTRQFDVSQWITVILAGRMVAYSLLRYLNETSLRDLPNRSDGSAVEWPPSKP